MQAKVLTLGDHRDTVWLPSACLGIEHEFQVWHGREQLDFRTLISDVAGHLRLLDPGDPRARRLPSGAALTADGREAEIASPPLPLLPSTPRFLDDLLRADRTQLRNRAADHGATALTGFSTHFNVSVGDDRVVEVARALIDTCLAALATVVEPANSQGLLVRPRRGRLEVCGEYVEGDDMVAGLTLLAGCVDGLLRGASPPLIHRPPATASREKFGWFVSPQALRDPGALVRVWEWARPFATGLGLDPTLLDDLARGSRRVRSARQNAITGSCTFAPPSIPLRDFAQTVDTGPRYRSGVRAETEWLTWSYAVWVFHGVGGRCCRAVVPAEREVEFLLALDSGALDSVLHQMLRRRSPRRLLVVNAQIHGAGLWHDVRPGALVPAERQGDGSVPRISVRKARRALVRSRRMRHS